MKRLAIIGTGIAGLGCAYLLRRHFALTLFEQNNYVGGHTNTVTVDEGGTPVPIDTGFMVFNKVTYPNLCRLFTELDVAIKPTDMSFSVQHVPTGLEYCGSSLNHLFAQRRNLVNPRFYALLWQVNRFNGEAVKALESPAYASHTVQQFVEERGYGADFLNLYLVPMSAAVWSTPPELMLEFPAMALIRFFHNHGFLGLHTQHPWWTVVNGAKSYVTKILQAVGPVTHLQRKVVAVQRNSAGVTVTSEDGKSETFDKVILASHADQTLAMLKDADAEERRLLGEFKYQPNLATLHKDASVMPQTKLAWSSWNYRINMDAAGKIQPSTIYWMNRLQGVSERENYFISINGAERVNPARILKQINYEHPLFSLGAIRAQQELPKLNQLSPGQAVYFAGSYFRYGFHEDAFTSAVDLCRVMLGKEAWS
ncbi:MAG: NAD(P)/FAD-dependent oxidoreductase [Verrucomicrobiota bacterium]